MGKKRRPIGLEMPRFGQFACQVGAVKSSDIEASLATQEKEGGRMGDILVDRGLLQPEQVLDVLRSQAEWVAATRGPDMPAGFPDTTTFSLCMPCFNEGKVIESCLDAACAILPAFLDEFEIIVVNDGSSDDTGEIVARYAARDSRIRLVNHEQNQGYGAAVTSGLRAASGDLVCFTDGDGQFSLLDIPQLLTQAHLADVVIGYRYERADPAMRKLNAWSWKQLIRMMLGVRVRDLDCAFKMFHRNVVDQLELTAEGACISAEILAQCVRGDISIIEVPVMHYPRYHGSPTGANLKVIAKAFRELPQLWKYRSMAPLTVEPRNGKPASPILIDITTREPENQPV